MKRLASALGGGLLFLSIAAPILAAPSSDAFKAVIHENFGRRASAEPCIEVGVDLACPGTGTVQGYGPVTSSILFPSDGISPLERTLTFRDGSTLVLNETGLGETRFPGKSQDAPGVLVSYGNPAFDHFAWVIVDGTGTFEGASGSGEWVNVLAGDTIVIKFTGTLSLSQ